MSARTLRGFQQEAVESGVKLFTAASDLIDAAGADAASRAMVVNHNGYLLIDAPTGSGKTLMAGTIVERFSAANDVVWFWFAPFKGVVGQTAAFLREQFPALHLRELADDRTAAMSRRGDVFVTTWQTVATRVKDKRNVRKEGDTNPSIDTLLESLRAQGLRIGVVVDEAHHGFGAKSEAAKFFRDVLKPEYTILITATPDESEVKDFEKAMGIEELQRIRVSRADAMDAGLIKAGVKCAAYFVEPEKRMLVDLQGTALRDGVAAHRKLKQMLADLKVPLVPLLLVQADSTAQSMEKMKARLLKHGFTEEQIAVHTAEEPDADLLTLANDDRREVLVFKMAVALGFDAPRAFTLVSMRASRDTDFGVQLVGRILRVHRRLQAKAQAKTLPEALNYGYVFLADAETQTGLELAGQRINAIQTEYAKASTATVVLRYGGHAPAGVSRVDPGGQVSFFGLEIETTTAGGEEKPENGETTEAPETLVQATAFDLNEFFRAAEDPGPPTTGTSKAVLVSGPTGAYRYPLRAGVPRRFKTQTVSPDNEVTEADCAQRFLVSTRDLFEAMRNKVPVERRTLDVFTAEMQREFNFAAELSPEQAALKAQDALCKYKTFDPRELRLALLHKLTLVMKEELMSEAEDEEKVKQFLEVIIATRPELLHQAQKGALADHAEISPAAELPEEVTWPEPLPPSLRNVYGIMPAHLNGWERDFAELLDQDGNNIVSWWHRNEPRQPWSINVLMDDGRGFYPDFIIGITGRKKEDNGLLADPKWNFQTDRESPKILAEHGTYGRVLILHRVGPRWVTVGYDEQAKKAIIAREFSLLNAAGF